MIASTLSRKGLHSVCILLNVTPLSNHTPDNLADMIINLSPEHFSELQKNLVDMSVIFPHLHVYR